MKRIDNGLIYLSGGMEYAKNLGAGWRIKCSEEIHSMGYVSIDITALDVAYTKTHGSVTDSTYDELQIKSNIRHQFITTDLRLIIEDADAVIAYYDEAFKNGAGSFAECQCAYDNGKPLFIVSAFPKEQMPSWLKALSTKIFFDFEDLYDYLAKLPNQVLGKKNSPSFVCSMCGNLTQKRTYHYAVLSNHPYCDNCSCVVAQTHAKYADRYEFISEILGL